ncbi:hypothetical protein [Acidocella sp. MX-AZ03]
MQPALGLAVSAVVLHETVPPTVFASMVAIAACVGGARRFI